MAEQVGGDKPRPTEAQRPQRVLWFGCDSCDGTRIGFVCLVSFAVKFRAR